MELKDHHVVIAGMPWVNSIHAPLAAPGVLKSALTLAGIKSTAMDLNIEVLVKVKSHPECAHLIKFFETQTAEDWVVQEVSKILFYCANRIISLKPTIIALSLLTYECQNFTYWLCAVLKEIYPQGLIVIGGPGIKQNVSSYSDKFLDIAKKLNLIDDYIAGDGEESLVEYVKGNRDYPGINNENWKPLDDLNNLQDPDWSDYNFYLYSQTYIPVIDAKGCVRNCEFCDVIEFWKKFKYRTAENIFEEMLRQIDRYGMKDFDFRSSISNGNLKEFRKLLQLMYDYNKGKYRPEQISWNASFIIRKESQHPEIMWEQMAATNATLSLGVESVVPHVRKDLGKHFENSDIDYHLEMAKKYNVKLIIMIITGYPTETLEGYEFTKQWFRDRVAYKDTISRLFLGPCAIIPNTGLDRHAMEYKIIFLNDDGKPMDSATSKSRTSNSKWQTETITRQERITHHKELVNLCRELGFNLDAY